jgi:hypothetical protein
MVTVGVSELAVNIGGGATWRLTALAVVFLVAVAVAV